MSEAPTAQETADRYNVLMAEIRVRLDSIDHTMAGGTGLAANVAYGLCYLQLRAICELMAVACLVAHQDIAGGTKLRRQWNAEKALKALQRLRPEFYPAPVDITTDARGEIASAPRWTASAFSAADLSRLYGETGSIGKLHRAHLESYLEELTRESVLSYDNARAWRKRIEELLLIHQINLPGGRTLVCELRDPRSDGRTTRTRLKAAVTTRSVRRPRAPSS